VHQHFDPTQIVLTQIVMGDLKLSYECVTTATVLASQAEAIVDSRRTWPPLT